MRGREKERERETEKERERGGGGGEREEVVVIFMRREVGEPSLASLVTSIKLDLVSTLFMVVKKVIELC